MAPERGGISRRGINSDPAPDLALQGEVRLTELCFEIAFPGMKKEELGKGGAFTRFVDDAEVQGVKLTTLKRSCWRKRV
jgi:hypothetical protein